MNQIVRNKICWIEHVWETHLFKYDYFAHQFKYNDYVRTNYIADALIYFQDLFGILERRSNASDFNSQFERTLSVLQSVYIQQDILEELLRIFGTRVDKGELKLNDNYSVNRSLRNELIGHPLRFSRKGPRELISSCIFINGSRDVVKFLKYTKDGGFESEKGELIFSDILTRHELFIDEYLDKCIRSIRKKLVNYSKELNSILMCFRNITLDKLLDRISFIYHTFLHEEYVFEKDIIILIAEKTRDHKRYQTCLEGFYRTLKSRITEECNHVNDLVKDDFLPNDRPTPEIVILDTNDDVDYGSIVAEDDSHLIDRCLGKLNYIDRYDIFAEILMSIDRIGEIAKDELRRMALNKSNRMEYYSSLYYIRSIMKHNELADD